MEICTGERRRTGRIGSAYPATVLDRRGRVRARGRSANISETGLFLLVSGGRSAVRMREVIVEVRIPTLSDNPRRGSATRLVRYACRVVRSLQIGHLVGLGLEFIGKVH